MKLFFLSLLFFSLSADLFPSQPADTIIIKKDDGVEIIERNLDSLVNSWYVKLAFRNQSFSPGDSVIPQFSDSIYKERLSRINSVINLPYNNIIRNHIHVYTERRRESLSAILGLSDYYFPIFEDIFDSYGLPAELKYMAVIESALNPNAVSRVGATGMWQFMYSTGRMYGMTINSIVDERRDPVVSAHAAARYIRDMYNIYKDWVLVIAAYNCGPGNVDKAIRRSGNRKDYWEIYYRLPRETRGYIPQYVAATYALNYYREHNIKPLQIDFPLATDTIIVSKDIHLTQVSDVLGIPMGELLALNTRYRTGLIPGASKPQPLTLPMSKISAYIDLDNTISRHKADVYLKKNAATVSPVKSVYLPADIKGKTKIYYTVKDGDNLGFIAEWYRVGLSDLRYWNDLYSNTIRVGQKLALFVEPAKADYFMKINDMSFAEKQATAGKTVPVTSQPVKTTSNSSADSEYITYTVGSGDTIWDIVKKFPNVTTSEVLALNKITDASRIHPGQVLKIKKK
jgi:membrane-bound lytic murein transglycosylase D